MDQNGSPGDFSREFPRTEGAHRQTLFGEGKGEPFAAKLDLAGDGASEFLHGTCS
jgi:hypothetical protein